MQNSFSLLDRGERTGAASVRAGSPILAFGPLCGGWLTGKYRRGEPFPLGSRMTQRPDPYAWLVSDATFDRLDRLTALASERGMTLAGLALAWLLSDDRVTQVVVGPMRPEHLDPLREALAHPLTALQRRDSMPEVLMLNGADVRQTLPPAQCAEAMAEVLAARARGDAFMPLRSVMVAPEAPG